ncbi:MAG TPA: hypothetical protein VHU22_14945 [Xanthobacteraceae bacterium]|jgi:hypothetical protein|nr:hypothetical protein [Xanthobacteraceae bacterium]
MCIPRHAIKRLRSLKALGYHVRLEVLSMLDGQMTSDLMIDAG